jgi:hypothetical protein
MEKPCPALSKDEEPRPYCLNLENWIYKIAMKETLNSMLKWAGFLTAVFIIIFLWSQHVKIESLSEKLRLCSETQYVVKRDTIRDTVPQYTEVILPSKVDTEYVEMIDYLKDELSGEDSLAIAQKIFFQIEDYNTYKKYDHVFKNDSSAYIQILAGVHQNHLVNPELIFENRLPIFKTQVQSPVNEIYAGMGINTLGPTINLGLKSKGNIFYQIHADPIHNYYGGSINVKIFKFK